MVCRITARFNMKISAFFQHRLLIGIDTILTINGNSFPIDYPPICPFNVFSIRLINNSISSLFEVRVLERFFYSV